MPTCGVAADRVRVSYDMNRLQRLTAPETFVVTLGGEDRVDPGRVLARMTYERSSTHPGVGGRPAAAPGPQRATHRLCGGLSRLGFPRGRLPPGRGAAAAALGVVW